MEGYVYLRSDWALFINLSLTHSDPSSILRSVLAGWSPWRCCLASFSSLSFSISFALFLLFLVPDDEGWSSYFLLEQGFPQWQWLLQLSLLLKQRHLFVEQAVVHLHVFCVNLYFLSAFCRIYQSRVHADYTKFSLLLFFLTCRCFIVVARGFDSLLKPMGLPSWSKSLSELIPTWSSATFWHFVVLQFST